MFEFVSWCACELMSLWVDALVSWYTCELIHLWVFGLRTNEYKNSRVRALKCSLPHTIKSLRVHKLINSLTHQLTNSPTYQLTNSPTHQLTNLPTHGLTNSRTHQPTHTPTSLWPSKALLRFAFNPLRQVQKIIFTTSFGFILADCTYFLLYRALFAIHLKEQVNDDK